MVRSCGIMKRRITCRSCMGRGLKLLRNKFSWLRGQARFKLRSRRLWWIRLSTPIRSNSLNWKRKNFKYKKRLQRDSFTHITPTWGLMGFSEHPCLTKEDLHSTKLPNSKNSFTLTNSMNSRVLNHNNRTTKSPSLKWGMSS